MEKRNILVCFCADKGFRFFMGILPKGMHGSADGGRKKECFLMENIGDLRYCMPKNTLYTRILIGI